MTENRWLLRFHGHKYAILLASLLLVCVLQPTLHGGAFGQRLFNGLFGVMLLAALFSVSQRGIWFRLALLLGIPAFALIWAGYAAGASNVRAHDALAIGRLAFDLVFLIMVVACVLSDVLKATEVTNDKLCGAMSVYLLLGLIWALIYWTILYFDPAAFPNIVWQRDTPFGGELPYGTFSAAVYFSFTTLTTLGYGDIVPATPTARSFAWLEAVVGQLFLAVLIARLVGLHIVNAGRKEQEATGSTSSQSGSREL